MLILFNGKVASAAKQTAVAIEGTHIAAVGSDLEILALETTKSKKIDLAGKCLWPGLIDSHLHLEMYALNLQTVNCETATQEECLHRAAEKAHSLPDGAWILGHGWNQNVWSNGFGSATELDAFTFGHPAFLSDKSLHSAWVNSQALQLASIDRNTPDPTGGIIQRTKNGLPTGLLFEAAVLLVQAIIPPPTLFERLALLRAAQQELIGYGLTGVTDFDPLSSYENLVQLQTNGELKLRVSKSIPFEKLDWAIEQGIHSGDSVGRIRWGAVKLFADGALGPQTAAMLRPYAGSETNYGKLQLTADDIFDVGIKASCHGLCLAVHAIGDKATSEVLNGYGMLREYERRTHLPLLDHRIEHLQLLHRDTLKKAVELGVTASMQPQHATSDMLMAEHYWGERAAYGYLFNTLISTGARVIFGSDAPVETPNPFWGIHAAVTRRRRDGLPDAEGWYPHERTSLAEALAAYSSSAAELDHSPERSGKFVPGALADLLILPVDPAKIDPQELFTIRPERVMINGDWVL